MMPKLLLATNNQGKVSEYKSLLTGLPYEITSLGEQGITTEVREVGETFEENAKLKATVIAGESKLLTLADDSGLEVDALGGEPGVRSARYAGENASDRERVDCLLAKLNGVPWEERTARFVCVIAIASPDGALELCRGECRGFIALAPKGELGFGYDPLFYFPELDKTMAELPMEIKNKVSHRGQAAQEAYKLLMRRL